MAMKRLLIVDDEVAIRTTLSHVFAQTGYTVRVASDGFTALAQMREGEPDVLLSDLNMPGMSGFELLSVVRRRMPAVYVIASSGAYKGTDVPEGIAADAFYEKASNFSALVAMMQVATEAVPPHALRRTETPLWVTRVGDEGSAESFGMITCPDCLRAHSALLAGAGLVCRETACRDCGRTIRYAVVPHLDPKTSQPYRVKRPVVGVSGRRGDGMEQVRASS